MLSDDQINRYSRHLLLDEFDMDAQEALLKSCVVLIGMGGLGNALAPYLVSSGVGELIIFDDDQVDIGNLQRQVLFTTDDVGRSKTEVAVERLSRLNPDVRLQGHPLRADEQALDLLARTKTISLIIDASDNFETRFALNRAAVNLHLPLVGGAATGFDGQLYAFSNQPGGPCYACIYPESAVERPQRCHDLGVFAPLVAQIGALQALVAMQILRGKIQFVTDLFWRFDANSLNIKKLPVFREPECRICGAQESQIIGR